MLASFILSILYFFILYYSYLKLSCIKNCAYAPSTQVLLILLVIVVVLCIQSTVFMQIYHSIYTHNNRSFAGSEAYRTREQAEAVKSLWLSKDTRKSYFFPNWLLLELSDSLIDTKSLVVFHDAYKLHYGRELNYGALRRSLTKDYPELRVKLAPKLLPANMPKEGAILDLPGVDEFITRLSSALSKHDIKLNSQDKASPVLNNIALLLLTIYDELSNDTPIDRLDVLLSIKSSEMCRLLTEKPNEEVRADIEKVIFYHLARTMLINSDELPSKLSRSDFLFYSALSFLSANAGDIQPVSTSARIFTFIQMLGTFVILAVAIAFLGTAIGGVSGLHLPYINRELLKPLGLISLALLCVIAVFYAVKYNNRRTNSKLLDVPENYGYSPKQDGTVDLMINVNDSSAKTYLSERYTLGIPYQPTLGSSVRCPGVLVTEDSSMIVWAELFPPIADRIYIYGEGFSMGDLSDKYKILIPGTFKAFSK